jgi:uncharacterized protein (DUF2141 family)
MKRLLFSLLALVVFTKILVLQTGCANPIAPGGGPKDSIPPMLVAVTPKDSARNFNAKTITFTFDEFIELQNIRENLVVSPTPKTEPQVESKLRSLTIKIKDTLEENTTYTYDFGSAIKDITEGNVSTNFTYVFSTGTTIDSLQFSGNVIIAQTGKVDSTMVAALYLNTDDSAVIKQRPRYIAKVNGTGYFTFHHLPPGQFVLYAMKDESGQYRYLSKKQLFAFADKPVTISSKNAPVTLYAYTEKEEEEKKTTTTAPNLNIRTRPGAAAEKAKQQDKRLIFKTNLENGQLDLLGNLDFIFPDPLKNFDSSKIQFVDEKYNPITGYSIVRDTSNKKISLLYKWKENTAYNLIVDKDFAEDSAGKKLLRLDTLKFRTMKETDYGSIRIRFANFDVTKKPVLQLFQGEEMKFSAKLTAKEFYTKLFKPGEYDIRILYDDNDNGIWDAGEFFGKHRQPEKVQSIKLKLTVKANWDKDLSIEL